MPGKKIEKTIPFLEPRFSEITSLENENLRPFIEVFIHDPENLTQQNLGILFGVLEITDNSEDSSYVVNYIISNVRKEFYKNPRRGSIESFESALHKANLSLSKLAQHENIAWIGKFNAFFGVIEKNNLHFSLAGEIAALLVRNKSLSDMGEGMTEEEKSNPLKTFTDIASGKLEDSDRLIISTPEISEVFSNEELKKASLRFTREKFIQFLKTALGGELPRVASLVIDLSKKDSSSGKRPASKKDDFNAWSQKTFTPAKKDLQEKVRKEIATDKIKTDSPGHIYMKESESPEEASENPLNKFRHVLNGTKDKLYYLSDRIKKPISPKKETSGSERSSRKINRTFWDLFSKTISRTKKLGKAVSQRFRFEIPSFVFFKKTASSLSSFLKNILQSFFRLPRKVKFIIVSFLAAILALLLFFPLLTKEPSNLPEADSRKSAGTETPSTEIESLPPISSQGNFQILSEKENFRKIALTSRGILGAGNSFLYLAEKDQEYPLESSSGEIIDTAYMEDLDLVFILTNQRKLFSFSPSTEKFQENNIELPSGEDLSLAGTYLTYLYVIDASNDKIVRYPRAEGGFGSGSDWLKEEASLDEISGSAINENVFLLQKGSLYKYWRGKKQPFPELKDISPSSLASFEDSSRIFVLDTLNGKISAIDNDGNIQESYSNDNLFFAKKILADKDNDKKFYFLMDGGKLASLSF